ncbi:biotin--[acetyl-CoA-carboxylase] ligase [Oceaniglobus roseus]|uniref:biotin--[acetyl-CoA-carboxylase] ligase n=1 Tax=Oceaniglobus roseus TaxID=1737570 RepID=UPI000C7EBFC5|nr:biotin--[acetyl-CoA-carboxylase] ligase [Kandeliimicrobium roseum]
MSTEPAGANLWPERYERLILDEVDSTNTHAARIAPELGHPTWIMAHRQTAAKGRRGRPWQSPPGHFAATLVMRPGGVAGWAALRSFMAANALFEALALHIERDRLANKWPNDVLLDNGKVAGILLESASTDGQTNWLAIGIGVNLGEAPEVRDAAFPPVGLAAQGGSPVLPEDFLTELAGFYATEEMILEQMGFAPIREKWLRNAARLGEVITARTGTAEIVGKFVTIDEAGQLVLDTPDGRQTIPAADIYF